MTAAEGRWISYSAMVSRSGRPAWAMGSSCLAGSMGADRRPIQERLLRAAQPGLGGSESWCACGPLRRTGRYHMDANRPPCIHSGPGTLLPHRTLHPCNGDDRPADAGSHDLNRFPQYVERKVCTHAEWRDTRRSLPRRLAGFGRLRARELLRGRGCCAYGNWQRYAEACRRGLCRHTAELS